ncbi:restriction endonuclease [Lactococcus petauri]|uniref:restriction endonuclease n=1 Tax=Lactococcus petauri TaxID=1940789 RepID=UPI0025500A0A|nr:restriction endonuclease [Lactococcus petauri]
MTNIPFEVQLQVIQCFGKCFHYKNTMTRFLRSCDVPESLISLGKSEVKYVWAKKVLDELSLSDDGRLIIRKIVTEFYKMRDIPSEVEKRDEGLEALRKLKSLARENSIISKSSQENQSYHQSQKELEIQKIQHKARIMDELKKEYYAQFSNDNVQKRGFELEKIISKLFNINEIPFEDSYRNEENTQQMDGYFRFEGFDYLVEAKWEKNLINSAKISTLKHKVDTKLHSTRGLFIAINGFREEVIRDYSNYDAKILFMNGEELMHILENRISLREALLIKIARAAKTGNPNASLL